MYVPLPGPARTLLYLPLGVPSPPLGIFHLSFLFSHEEKHKRQDRHRQVGGDVPNTPRPRSLVPLSVNNNTTNNRYMPADLSQVGNSAELRSSTCSPASTFLPLSTIHSLFTSPSSPFPSATTTASDGAVLVGQYITSGTPPPPLPASQPVSPSRRSFMALLTSVDKY